MQLTSATSIFRCMPSMLPLHFRRLLGAFAYAVDGAELAYCRMLEAALEYELPRQGATSGLHQWTARNRLTIINDAWALVDQVSRARKLVSRFPWDQSKGIRELNQFIRDTKDATLVRNRLHQLDEDVYSRVDSDEGHSILGTVSWVDSRQKGRQVRFAVSSGPSVEAEEMVRASGGHAIPKDQVAEFHLHVCECGADLDALHDAMLQFAKRLETAVGTSVREFVSAEAKRRQVPIEQLCESSITDTTVGTSFRPAAADGWQSKADRTHVMAEVQPDAYNPATQKHRSPVPDIS